MPVTKVLERQYALNAVADLTIANIGAGNEVTLGLPVNAVLLAIYPITTTAFNGTTNTLTVSDGTTTFVSAVDVKTTGLETAANTPKYYPTGGTLTVSMAQTGTATAGRAMVVAQYIVLGRGGEIQA